MNTTPPRARDIEASALTTTSDASPGDTTAGDRAANRVTAIARPAGTSLIALAGALLITAAVAFLWFLTVSLLPSTKALADESPQISRVFSRACSPGTLPATLEIVPAQVIDSSGAFFIGTGDGSAGSWSRP